MLKRVAEFGTKVIVKVPKEENNKHQDTFGAAGEEAVYLWPVRNGVAYTQFELDVDGNRRLGVPRFTRDAKICYGEYAFKTDGEEEAEKAKETVWPEPIETETLEPVSAGPSAGPAEQPKRGRGRPPRRVVEIDVCEKAEQIAGTREVQEWMIEQALEEELLPLSF